ncbi:MAG: tetratricopeptide repeat protein [Ferruginibacter sp.]
MISIASCNNSQDEEIFKNISVEDSVNKSDEISVMTANMYFDEKMYKLAIPYYDSLIIRYPQKGSFYYKRGYCKSEVKHDDPSAISDYFRSIELNYSQKQLAFYNIGSAYHFSGLFRSTTEEEKIVKFDSAIYYYNECLKINPNNNYAIKGKEEVTNNLIIIQRGVWPSTK